MKYLKKIKLLLFSLLIVISNISIVKAKETPENISSTFKDNINLVFADNGQFTVHQEGIDVTENFIRDNTDYYNNDDYSSIWNYFTNNCLYILGPQELSKETSTSSRAISTITYRVSQYYFTTLVAPNGHPSVEFQAYVHCQAQYNDRTGLYISVGQPYFGEVVRAPDNAQITVYADKSTTDGTYCHFNLRSFQVKGFAMSGMLGTFVTYNKVTCNISGTF